MSAEACRNQASKFSLQAPHWPMRYDFGAADIRIGQTKSVHISWNPGRNFENQMGYLSEANELQPGLVPSHCYLPATQKVTVYRYPHLRWHPWAQAKVSLKPVSLWPHMIPSRERREQKRVPTCRERTDRLFLERMKSHLLLLFVWGSNEIIIFQQFV